jgi:ankyrin repeat protein
MRQILKETVKRRHDEAFQALAWAVTSGDLEEVRRMLRKGVGINASNYDGKTVLHMASVEGNYRVVELLLQEGAEKNKRDRWGNTALQDAINHNQGPVIQLLVQWKSELNNDNAAGRLCDAASAGDLDTLKLILEHGVDPNCGDYDSRTPLHLAAAEGQDKAVQYLIAKGADVNYKDRWGATPLQDAVQSGHLQVAEQILSRGGFMVTELGPAAMCNAATEGDVRYLKLLIRCGVDPDVGDYDFRCPMHLAAAEGRLLAVSYLLGVSANPNAKDRWGGTPMVRANVECLSGICAVVFLIGAAWQAFSFC